MSPASASTLPQIRQYLGMIETARQGEEAALNDGSVAHFEIIIAKLMLVLTEADLAAAYDEALKVGEGAETVLFANEIARRQAATTRGN